MASIGLKQALEELRKEKKRKFSQTLDLIVNLKGVDLRRDNISFVASIPHKLKEKNICGFLEEKNPAVKTITKVEFEKYKDKDALKELVDKYDFFIANAKLMPAVATTFGKALGPAGKMPSPQLGIIMDEKPEIIKALIEKISRSVKLRAKEASMKIAVGKEDMSDEAIMENVRAVYASIVNSLPKKDENVKNVKVKFTMSKPVSVEVNK